MDYAAEFGFRTVKPSFKQHLCGSRLFVSEFHVTRSAETSTSSWDQCTYKFNACTSVFSIRSSGVCLLAAFTATSGKPPQTDNGSELLKVIQNCLKCYLLSVNVTDLLQGVPWSSSANASLGSAQILRKWLPRLRPVSAGGKVNGLRKCLVMFFWSGFQAATNMELP